MFRYVLIFLFMTSSYAEVNEENFTKSFMKCFRDGKVKGKVRVRHEFVDESNRNKDANALTFSGRLGYDMTCLENDDLHIFVEMQGNWGVVNDYNSTLNGKTDYPVVADPDEVQLNNAFLEYQLTNWLKVKGGRFEKVWDDASLVGNVAWRNMSTSFDGVEAIITPEFLKDTRIELGYMGNWLNVKNQDLGMDTFLGRIVYSGFDDSEVSTHAILLDYEDNKLDPKSSATYGLVYWIDRPLTEDVKLKLDLAGDVQHDYGDNPNDYTVYRTMVRGTVSIKNISFYVGNELLTANSKGNAFQRDLATLHAVNGWADQFLTTPKEGLIDTEVGLVFKKLFGGKLKVSGHFYDSDRGDTHYGEEIDLAYVYPLDDFLPKGSNLTLKAAHFFGDETSSGAKNKDVTKAWGQIEVPFGK